MANIAYNPYYPNLYPQQSYSYTSAAAPVQQRPMGGNVLGYQVDGEVGAKAFPFQNGSTEPLALWDMNDNIFYLRSYNQAGFPNPLKRYRYIEEEMPQALPAAGLSGATQGPDMKNEIDALRQEIRSLAGTVQQMQTQNSGPNFNQNGSHNVSQAAAQSTPNGGNGRGRQ